MKRFIASLHTYAPSVLRYGMSAVILWFGSQQLMHAADWTAYVPDSAVSLTHLSVTALVYINGAAECILGILLVLGWQTRIVALLLGLHLLDIAWIVGYGQIGVRDFGLALATLAVSMHGPDILCIQQKRQYNEMVR